MDCNHGLNCRSMRLSGKAKKTPTAAPVLEPWVVDALRAADAEAAAAADAEAAAAAAAAVVEAAATDPGVLVPFSVAKRPSSFKLSDRHQHMPRLFTAVGAPQQSLVLVPCAIEQLAQAVPTRYSLSDWRLLYSTHVHGISINTLYLRRCGPALGIRSLRPTSTHAVPTTSRYCASPYY